MPVFSFFFFDKNLFYVILIPFGLNQLALEYIGQGVTGSLQAGSPPADCYQSHHSFKKGFIIT